MTRSEAIRRLRACEPDLRSKGVIHLRVFGSVARDEATQGSDLDLLADFDPAMRISLLDIVRIENELRTMIGTRVDLMEERSLKQRIREHAVQEAVIAF